MSASNHRTAGPSRRPTIGRAIRTVGFCLLVAPVMLTVLVIGELLIWICGGDNGGCTA